MALETKGTFENGVFDAGSRTHFTVVGLNLTVDAVFEAFVKNVQGWATIVEIGVRGTGVDAANATRFAVENNGVTAAALSTATGGTIADFAY